MHLNEERIQRLLDEELSPPEESSVRAHLDECEECRARVASAEHDAREIHALLRALDHRLPPVDAEMVAERARRGRETGEALRRAALILVGIGIVGAAYAVPGSPLRAWVNDAVQWIGSGERLREDDASSTRPVPRADSGLHGSGVAVEPGKSFVIEFVHPQRENRASVTHTSGREVVVHGPPGAATYSAGAQRIDIVIRDGAAAFYVEIPESAPRVEIRAGGASLFLKEGARVSTRASEGPSRSYGLSLAPTDSTH